MDIVVSTATHASFLVWNHPLYTALAAVVGFVLLVRFYLKLTLGMCHCTTDLSGKTAIVTGASSGIGVHTAKVLAERGARVILACRNEEKASNVKAAIVRETNNKDVHVKLLDLSSLASVKTFANGILASEQRLDLLINNAGISGSDRELTEDGYDTTMQSNHLGHFLLTLLLLDLMKKSSPSRIINVSSMAYKMARLNLNDLSHEKGKTWLAKYCASKMANVLFTLELCRRLKGTGVTANVLHPGVVDTGIMQQKFDFFSIMTKMLIYFFSKTSFEGAQTTIHLALSPDLQHVSGKFFRDCREMALSRWALNESHGKQLWTTSEKLVGLQMKD